MSSFTRPLDVRQIGENRWKVLSPFIYWIGKEGSGDFIFIDKGFETDFSSVPWIFQWLVPKYGGQNHGSVLHDFLYRYQFYWTTDTFGNVSRVKCSRKMADMIFLEANAVKKVFWTRRKLIYAGLRLGGWAAFKNPDKYKMFEPTHILELSAYA